MSETLFSLEIGDAQAAIAQMGYTGTAVSKENLHRALLDLLEPNCGLLPPVIRWVSPSLRTWCLERPPHVVTIGHHNYKLNTIDDKVKEQLYEIALPWTAYVVDLDQTYYPENIFVYALNGQLQTMKDPIGVLPLPNFYASGMLCPPHRGSVGEQPASVAEGLALAYRMCWSSGFNMDLGSAFVWSREQGRPAVLFKDFETTTKGQVLTLVKAWDQASLETIAGITDWAAPMHFERDELGEPLSSIRTKARASKHQYAMYHAAHTANNIDIQRRGEGGTATLLMTFQQAMASAALMDG